MEITYPLDRMDYWRFSQAIIRRTPALRRQAVTRCLFLPLIVAVELSFLHIGPVLYWTILVFGTALWIGYMVWVQKRTITRGVDLRPGAIGTHTMRLEANGFREQTPCVEISVRWDKVTQMFLTADHVLILLGPQYGFLVPRRAFGSVEQCEAFLETARAYWQAVRDGTTPALPPVSAVWPPAPRTLA